MPSYRPLSFGGLGCRPHPPPYEESTTTGRSHCCDHYHYDRPHWEPALVLFFHHGGRRGRRGDRRRRGRDGNRRRHRGRGGRRRCGHRCSRRCRRYRCRRGRYPCRRGLVPVSAWPWCPESAQPWPPESAQACRLRRWRGCRFRRRCGCWLRRGCRCRGRGRHWRRLGCRHDYNRYWASEGHHRHFVGAIPVGVGNSRTQVLALVRCFRCVRRRGGPFNGSPSHLVLGALPLPTDDSHIPIGVHHGGREFAADLGGLGRDVDHPLFVNVGDPDADGNVVEPPAVVHGSRGDGVGALGLEVKACALGHRQLAGLLVDVKQLGITSG